LRWALPWRLAPRPVLKQRSGPAKREGVALHRAEAGTFPVSFAIHTFERESDGDAVLKFGVDWRARIWCNGEQVYECLTGCQGDKFVVPLKLKKGRNVLAFKIGSGSYGNCFWTNLSQEAKAGEFQRKKIPELDSVSLYETRIPKFDPYRFVYW
jgi:hypothetical protein